MRARIPTVEVDVHGVRRGWWLREALEAEGADAPPAPSLRGDEEADVVVLGGGYTGMWTAWFLTERRPGIRVTVLEQDVCGGGPSGRNGGFATGWWDELETLVHSFGEEPAVRTARALDDSIRAMGAWSQANGVDAWYTPGGALQVSTSEAQDGRWGGSVRLAARLGAAESLRELSGEEVRARCDSPLFRGGAYMPVGASVQPAFLARGMRRALLERGVTIHEGTPVLRFRGRSSRPSGSRVVEVETPEGRVRAGQGVLALNAWAIALPRFRRRLATWGSYIVLTAPAPELLEKIGWTGGECITDARFALHYFRATRDGRIAFGGGGGRAGVGSRIGRRLHDDSISFARAEEGLRRLFPMFADVPVEEAWGGPIDVSPNHLPYAGTLPGGRLHYAWGYSGNGVAPSHLMGRALSAMAVDDTGDQVLMLPLVGHEPRRFPPEPIRSVGAYVVREATVRKERAEDDGRRTDPLTRLLARAPRILGYPLGSD